MAKKKSNKQRVLRSDANIGNNSAEADDDYLFKCFVDHPALSQITDIDSAKMFISGRTGVGKTAFMRMIEKNQTSTSEIDLADLALGYVANSDIIQFLNALGVDLDIFFQTLWKHVFCIEYIRLRYNVRNSSDSKSWFASLCDYFRKDEAKKRALSYLSNWENKFWITMDENIKEITQKIESSIDAELSTEIKKFKGRAGYARSLSQEKRSALIARAKKIINADLLSELGKVLNLLAEFNATDKYNNQYYILIDRLDEKWVDDSIRYQLIRALIECLKSFRKIRNLKVVVTMRSDVLERIVQENNHAGFQREKYDDYFLKLKWDKEQLLSLVNKRISLLFRKQYSSDSVFFYDVFDRQVGTKDSFDYILERTLMRPRDVISFVNICLELSEGKNKVPQSAIRKAESEYSRIRLQALIEEWESAFPSLEVAFDLISKRGRNFKTEEIHNSEFVEDFILEVDDRINCTHDPVASLVKKSFDKKSPGSERKIPSQLLSEMYRIGAISLKLSPNDSFKHSHDNVPVIKSNLITEETKIRIHPMLQQALNVEIKTS